MVGAFRGHERCAPGWSSFGHGQLGAAGEHAWYEGDDVGVACLTSEGATSRVASFVISVGEKARGKPIADGGVQLPALGRYPHTHTLNVPYHTVLPAPCPFTSPLPARSIDFGTLECAPENASPSAAPSLGRQLVDASSKIFRYVQLGQTSAYVGLQVGTGVPCRRQARTRVDPYRSDERKSAQE